MHRRRKSRSMRCQDAKLALAAQHDGDLAQSDVLELQEIRLQQRSREARLRIIGPLLVVVVISILGGMPLLLLAAAIFQPDLMVKTLTWLSDAVGMLVMMAMWLRLMRHPQEV